MNTFQFFDMISKEKFENVDRYICSDKTDPSFKVVMQPNAHDKFMYHIFTYIGSKRIFDAMCNNIEYVKYAIGGLLIGRYGNLCWDTIYDINWNEYYGEFDFS